MSQFQKRNNYTEKNAKSKEAAIEAALSELGVTADEVDIEILDEGSKGFLGLGARDARVRVTLKNKQPQAEEKVKIPVQEPQAEIDTNVQVNTNTEVSEEKTVVKESLGSPEEDARKFLTDIFAAMNLDVKVDVKLEGECLTVNLDGENMGIVIGKRGDTLDSLQYLTSLVVNQRCEDYIKVTIDTENYREKRAQALISLSQRLASKVAKTGRKFTLEPMNPYERRIIHANLQDSETVTTYSVGSEPYRKVVIAPKNAKPFKKDNRRRRTKHTNKPVAEKTGEGYTTTYKADFKPQQHKAEYKNFEDYLAGHSDEFGGSEE